MIQASFNEWSDERLVKQIQRCPGRDELWSCLLERYQRRLYSRAYHTCNGDPEDARDLLQEIHVALVQAIPRYRGRSLVTTYIFSIARNVCAQWLKRKRRSLPRASPGDVEQGDIDRAAEPGIGSSLSAEPGNHLAHRETVRAILQRLKPGHREILRLFFLEGFSHRELALHLGLESEGTSRKRLHDAVSALRDICRQGNISAEDLRMGLLECDDEMS